MSLIKFLANHVIEGILFGMEINMKRFSLIFISLIVLIGCQKSDNKDAIKRYSIRLASATTLLTTPIVIAQKKGFFKEQGLDIILNESFSSGKAAFQHMLSGRADISTVATTPMVLASFNRNDFYTFITYTTTYDGIKLITRKGSGIKNARDFRGKKIAVVKGTISEYLIYSYLVFHKIGLNEITMIHSTPADMPKKLKSGSVDVVAVWEPYADKTLEVLGSDGHRIEIRKVYRMAINCAVMKAFVHAKPEALVKFTASINKAVDFMKNNKIASQKLIARVLDLDKELVKKKWHEYNYGVTLDQLLIITMESEAQWSIYKGFVKKQAIPNYLGYIYVDALKKVKPDSVTLIHK